jgi:peroxiredoxin
MTDRAGRPLGPGDLAPDFDLPAADHEGRISLADHYRRGPLLLLLLRGLYCAFCRRQISQLKSSCDLLQGGGISMLGVVIASPERSRLYFKFRARPCCPTAAAPDRSVHRAYGLGASARTPELMGPINQRAAEILRDLNVDGEGDPLMALHHHGGWVDTPEDEAEFKRPLQSVGYYLIDRQGVIRWARVGDVITDVPGPESLLTLV